jgi:hypothetical protein
MGRVVDEMVLNDSKMLCDAVFFVRYFLLL